MKRITLVFALAWLAAGCSSTAQTPVETPSARTASALPQHVISPRPSYLEAPPGCEEMEWEPPPEKPEPEEIKPRKATAQPHFVSTSKRHLFVLPSN